MYVPLPVKKTPFYALTRIKPFDRLSKCHLRVYALPQAYVPQKRTYYRAGSSLVVMDISVKKKPAQTSLFLPTEHLWAMVLPAYLKYRRCVVWASGI